MALLSFPSYVALQFKEGSLDCQPRESGRFSIIVPYGARHMHAEWRMLGATRACGQPPLVNAENQALPQDRGTAGTRQTAE